MELDARGAAEVLAALDRLEADGVVPRVEAAERRRLVAAAGRGPVADPKRSAGSAWASHRLDGWYLGLRTVPTRPDAPDAPAAGDRGGAVGEAGRLSDGPIGPVLATAAEAGAGRVWLRGTSDDDVAAAAASGWGPARTLLVLGRALPTATPAPQPALPPGLHLLPAGRADLEAVAGLLARAYDGPRRTGLVEEDGDAGPWSEARLAGLARVALADPTDLLVVADAAGRPVGVHWTGRRAHGVGEVVNLAVDPGSGRAGLGRWLLDAGLAHLAATGHHTVILWVDERNLPARELYGRAGFAEQGRDVALEPTSPRPGTRSSSR